MVQMKDEIIYKTDEKSILQEIIITVKEYFDCKIVQSGGCALLSLNNGQQFSLTVEEVQ